jgi:hypothetical protein
MNRTPTRRKSGWHLAPLAIALAVFTTGCKPGATPGGGGLGTLPKTPIDPVKVVSQTAKDTSSSILDPNLNGGVTSQFVKSDANKSSFDNPFKGQDWSLFGGTGETVKTGADNPFVGQDWSLFGSVPQALNSDDPTQPVQNPHHTQVGFDPTG